MTGLKLKQLKDEFTNSPTVKITMEDDFTSLDNSVVSYLAEIQGYGFPKHVVEFYSSTNGFYLKWKSKIGNGSFLFPGFLAMFTNLMDENDHENAFEGILWTKTDYDKKEISERKKHKVFEFFAGDSPCTTIKFKDDETYQLFFVDSELYPIPLTINGYTELVSNLYGFGNFRYYLHDPNFYMDPLKFCPELKDLHKAIPAFNIDALDFKQYLTIQ